MLHLILGLKPIHTTNTRKCRFLLYQVATIIMIGNLSIIPTWKWNTAFREMTCFNLKPYGSEGTL